LQAFRAYEHEYLELRALDLELHLREDPRDPIMRLSYSSFTNHLRLQFHALLTDGVERLELVGLRSARADSQFKRGLRANTLGIILLPTSDISELIHLTAWKVNSWKLGDPFFQSCKHEAAAFSRPASRGISGGASIAVCNDIGPPLVSASEASVRSVPKPPALCLKASIAGVGQLH
jgi:hypothetical protein